MIKVRTIFVIKLLGIILFIGNVHAQLNWDMANAGDINKIVPEREQAEIFNEILEWRLDSLLPKIMRREGIDMWLVLNLEYIEDPVYMSLVKQPAFNARRLSILIFHDSPNEGFRKLNACWWSHWSCGPMYEDLFTEKDRDKSCNHQFTVVADYIKKHDPKKIGINYAEHWDYHDSFSHGLGLSAFLKEKLERSLSYKYRKRLVSAEHVCIGWLETRSHNEIKLYKHLCGIAHDLIAESLSNMLVAPGVTTIDDLRWGIRQRITDLGLKTWFQPSASIKRSPADSVRFGKDDRIIRRGDIIHTDIGINYLGLNTDMQHSAYVLRIEEEEPPEGVKELLRRGNRVQEIFLGEFKKGRTGNELLNSTLEKTKAEGIEARIYTHPVGFYGHGSGMMVGMWDKQEFVPGTGEHPLYPNTVYAIELGVSFNIPEWDNRKTYLGLEEQGVFTENGIDWVDGYPRTYYLIK